MYQLSNSGRLQLMFYIRRQLLEQISNSKLTIDHVQPRHFQTMNVKMVFGY